MAVDNRTSVRDYPLPNSANLLSDDVLRLIAALEAIDTDVAALFSGLAQKAALVHAHAIGDVTGLQDALNSKAASDHGHALNDLSDVNVAGAANGQFVKRVGTAWSPATVQIGDVSGLQDALEGATLPPHSHVIGDITGLQGALDAKSGLGHTHLIANVTGLQGALDGKQANLNLSGKANAADMRGGTNDTNALTVSAAYAGAAEVVLAYANPLSINFSTGTNFVVTLTGSPLINATGLTNVVGKMGRIRFIQGGAGNHEPSWGAPFKFSDGEPPAFSPGSGAEDIGYYDVLPGGRVLLALNPKVS